MRCTHFTGHQDKSPCNAHHGEWHRAWEWIMMKITENILHGGTPKKIWNKKTHFEHFGAFLSIIKMILGDKKKRKSVKKLKTLMPVTYPIRNKSTPTLFLYCSTALPMSCSEAPSAWNAPGRSWASRYRSTIGWPSFCVEQASYSAVTLYDTVDSQQILIPQWILWLESPIYHCHC